MKQYETVESDRRFMPLLPVCARLDGKGFSRFTQDLKRPSVVFPGYLFLKGAAKTQAQFIFRIGLFTIGAIGLIVTEVVKRLR